MVNHLPLGLLSGLGVEYKNFYALQVYSRHFSCESGCQLLQYQYNIWFIFLSDCQTTKKLPQQKYPQKIINILLLTDIYTYIQQINKHNKHKYSTQQYIINQFNKAMLPKHHNNANISDFVSVKIQEDVQHNVCVNNTDRYRRQNGPFLITKDGNRYIGCSGKALWTNKQKARYSIFILNNIDEMEGKPHGRLWTIHQNMARFIKTRNFRQCKSYHQKMITQHTHIQNVVNYLLSVNPELETEIQFASKEYIQFKTKQKSIKIKNLSAPIPQPIEQILEQNIKNNKDDQIPTDIAYRQQQYEPKLPNNSHNTHKNNTNKFPSFFSDQNLTSPNKIKSQTDLVNSSINKFPTNFNYNNNTNYPPTAFFPNQYFNQYYSHSASHHTNQHMNNNKQSNRQKQWQQCHRLFLEWTSRLNQLMMMGGVLSNQSRN